ncbi:MAG: S24/S26 family peptidase [Clostridia bacterium]|nr:S24/S26 family peptidase [Clostridia bacterium]
MEREKLKIEDAVAEQGFYIGPTVGVSMLPMLKNRRDTIVVKPKTERLKRLDVALYKRGDDYVLHRVLAPVEGGYIIRGDNCYADENVPEEAVFGVLTEFFRKDKHILCTDKKYLRYAERRVKTYRFRRFFVRIKWKITGAIKKILRVFGIKK